jgi:hypothetical protein
MKTITIFNWAIIGACFLAFLYPIVTAKTQEERMAASMLIMIYFPLAFLALLNFLPYKWTRVTVFVIIAFPIVSGIISFIINFSILMFGGQIEGYDINRSKQTISKPADDPAP